MADVTLHLGDCLPFMRQFPDACVDAVIADPPFGIGFKYSTYLVHDPDFSAACQEAMNYAQMPSAEIASSVSAELLSLAARVVEQQNARKNEDVTAWVHRLAQDVGSIMD